MAMTQTLPDFIVLEKYLMQFKDSPLGQ